MRDSGGNEFRGWGIFDMTAVVICWQRAKPSTNKEPFIFPVNRDTESY